MRLILLAIVLLVPGFSRAETPYAGMQTRQVKALSDQQIADLRAGRGMGLALAAELNGYPGPSHVLELADQLALRPDQHAKVQDMFAAMKSETTPIGRKLVDEESELDEQFAGKTINPDSLRSATTAIAKTQGELREAHLKYHLLTYAVLDETQLAKYAELRGYAGAAPTRHHHHQK
ncbi:hypothetical protein JQ596_19375 [Bradyrhizobium manausense]|uniref:hypothetical protein n=1 Tax=Bradyrhizobium TaxID=374 RepID=UPI001BA4F426|nr:MULTISPECIES: hypothetical protein [Bradyrhizobium]MBR0827693.1 hypothetical protein [Bradyrhizobium manausense]UVO26169.1 hypothetical protein KUF59_26835 [Bradyrhizobium arachidis]